MTGKKKGILLNNIGTPDEPTPEAVGRYLSEFLMDEEILNIPTPIRAALVHGLIVPKRKKASAEKYKLIWHNGQSPLLKLSQEFAEALQLALGQEYVVKLGMRYGRPSMEQALREIQEAGAEQIVLVPLYPQYSRATTYSAEKKLKDLLKGFSGEMKVKTFTPFYRMKAFVDISAEKLKADLSRGQFEHVLFSFHGLPVSQVKQVDGCLTEENCCNQVIRCDLNCYRAQCFATARAIASTAKLPTDHYSICFQSRLGPAKWIGPSSLEIVDALAEKGYQRLLVQTPSFVTDCLETLEEVAMGLKEHFFKRGGQELKLVPCLNSDKKWVQAFAQELKYRW